MRKRPIGARNERRENGEPGADLPGDG